MPPKNKKKRTEKAKRVYKTSRNPRPYLPSEACNQAIDRLAKHLSRKGISKDNFSTKISIEDRAYATKHCVNLNRNTFDKAWKWYISRFATFVQDDPLIVLPPKATDLANNLIPKIQPQKKKKKKRLRLYCREELNGNRKRKVNPRTATFDQNRSQPNRIAHRRNLRFMRILTRRPYDVRWYDDIDDHITKDEARARLAKIKARFQEKPRRGTKLAGNNEVLNQTQLKARKKEVLDRKRSQGEKQKVAEIRRLEALRELNQILRQETDSKASLLAAREKKFGNHCVCRDANSKNGLTNGCACAKSLLACPGNGWFHYVCIGETPVSIPVGWSCKTCEKLFDKTI